MKNIWIRITLLGGLVVALTACGSAENTQAAGSQTGPGNPISKTAPSTQESQKDITQMTQPEQPVLSSGMEFLIEKAKDDLAKRLSIDVTQISLGEGKEVVWPDASLGCPQPGMMYAQVETEGFLFLLETQGQIYEYHTNMDNTVILCESTPEEKKSNKDIDKNVEDGWPNQTKDKDVIIVTPTPRR